MVVLSVKLPYVPTRLAGACSTLSALLAAPVTLSVPEAWAVLSSMAVPVLVPVMAVALASAAPVTVTVISCEAVPS